jgi:uncharacterized phiE125 gp8 family phage protein
VRYSLTVKTAPAAEPVTREEAKAHCHIDVDDDDALIDALCKAARQYCENFLRRTLISTTYELRLDGLVSPLRIPRAPLASVSSISYVDSAGVTQTLAASQYTVDSYGYVGRIVEAYGCAWPAVRGHTNDVLITFVAGYGASGASVPADIIAGLKLLIGHLYEHRESVVIGATPAILPMAVESLWAPYRVHDEF